MWSRAAWLLEVLHVGILNWTGQCKYIAHVSPLLEHAIQPFWWGISAPGTKWLNWSNLYATYESMLWRQWNAFQNSRHWNVRPIPHLFAWLLRCNQGSTTQIVNRIICKLDLFDQGLNSFTSAFLLPIQQHSTNILEGSTNYQTYSWSITIITSSL